MMRRQIALALCSTLLVAAAPNADRHGTTAPAQFDVRAFGAKGDGTTIDSDAINRAIDAASAAGGGTVDFPAGTYASYSIRLRSHVGLHLEHGATLLAADTSDGHGYDPADAGPGNAFQDFGHSHWHNSLIWGENIEDVSITGSGRIDGRGLSRGLTASAADVDRRPAIVLDDVRDVELHRMRAQKAPGVPTLVLRDVEELRVMHSPPLSDVHVKAVKRLSY